MIKSEQRSDAPLPEQIAFWNDWNARTREQHVDRVSKEQARVVTAWLERLRRNDLDIVEVGCGAGWLCGELARFGRVTGTDLSHEVLARVAERLPAVRFVAGDFTTLDLGPGAFDVVISLEVLSHMADQPAFLAKISSLLRPGGILILATQNRPVLERNDVPPPAPGQIRRWVDRHELGELLSRHFIVEEIRSITPQFNAGPLRYVNSGKLRSLLTAIGLGAANGWVQAAQEKAWLGWTLMALARRREQAG